jgi:hypothetical protein
MKCCSSSSGCETRPAKGEPARAGSQPCAGGRHALGDALAGERAGRGTAAPKPLLSGCRACWNASKATMALCVSGRGVGRIRRGVRPQHVRRGWLCNLGGPRLSSQETPVSRRAGDPSPTHGTLVGARVVGLMRHRRSVRREGGHRKGNRSGGRWRQGVGGLHTSADVGE